MKNFITLLLLAAFSVGSSQAQISYDAASIPAELKEDAHVVKRFEDVRFVVKDIDRAVLTVHRVYTILDEKGAHRLRFAEATTKYRRIDEFEIKGYDKNGKMIEKFRKKDLSRQAILGDFVTDGNYHYIRLGVNSYPATIEYRYEIEYSGTAWYPSFDLQEADESVENATFTAIVPANLDLRFKLRNTALAPLITNDGDTKKYEWKVRHAKAIPEEESQVNGVSNMPVVFLAPNKFRLYDTWGDMSTWKNFGTWNYELAKGIDEIPEERKQFFAALVKNAKTEREKVALVYDYLQKNFRYVSIQLGIGGWKPFPAVYTDEKKYGDCKGLSFFVQSVLKSLGIKSYTALVYRDHNQEPADPAFPYNRFNHVILCVPQTKDSIWLECTSNTAEFGVLDATTSDKNALLITENGGVLVATPKGEAKNNMIASTTNVMLAEDGSGETKTSLTTRGEIKDIMLQMVEAKKDEQKEMIISTLGFKQPDEFVVQQKGKTEFLDMDIQLAIEKVPHFMAGSKMFLGLRLNSFIGYKLPKSENRKQDFYFRFPFTYTDTTIYHLPEGYTPEVLPSASSLKCSYADYNMECRFDAEKKQLVSILRFHLYKNRIPAAGYAELKSFFDKVISQENQKLVVKKN